MNSMPWASNVEISWRRTAVLKSGTSLSASNRWIVRCPIPEASAKSAAEIPSRAHSNCLKMWRGTSKMGWLLFDGGRGTRCGATARKRFHMRYSSAICRRAPVRTHHVFVRFRPGCVSEGRDCRRLRIAVVAP